MCIYSETNTWGDCKNLVLAGPDVRKNLRRTSNAAKIGHDVELQALHSMIRDFAEVFGPPCVFGDIQELHLFIPSDHDDCDLIKDLFKLLNCGIRHLTIHCDTELESSPDFMCFLEGASTLLPRLSHLKIVYDWEAEMASSISFLQYMTLIETNYSLKSRCGPTPGKVTTGEHA